MLTEEQTKEIKKQILSQIEENFPEDKKLSAKQQIEDMNSEEIEQFLIQNNLIKEGEDLTTPKCVFCSIIQGKVNSYKIGENNGAIAILEINPISNGHTLIIPKEHSEEQKISDDALMLVKTTRDKIKKELNPKDIEIYTSTLFEHGIINVLPVYDKENLNSERKTATPEELLKIQDKLKDKPIPQKPIEKQKPQKIENIKLPKRIP
jgi:diadenosine tetraphosphate (Ap4A) HIT family hydrolase